MCLDSFLKTVLWFFPVVYWLHRRSDETREALSDARAIQHSRTARDYAQLILRLAESLVPQASPVHICFYTRRGDRVLRRFSRILTFGGNTETACAWKNGFPLVLAMSMLLFFLSGLRVAPLEGCRSLRRGRPRSIRGRIRSPRRRGVVLGVRESAPADQRPNPSPERWPDVRDGRIWPS